MCFVARNTVLGIKYIKFFAQKNLFFDSIICFLKLITYSCFERPSACIIMILFDSTLSKLIYLGGAWNLKWVFIALPSQIVYSHLISYCCWPFPIHPNLSFIQVILIDAFSFFRLKLTFKYLALSVSKLWRGWGYLFVLVDKLHASVFLSRKTMFIHFLHGSSWSDI